MTDDDMTLLEEAAHRAEHIEAELADEYKATAVDVDRHAHDEDSRLSITLAFCGFANFETAREKVSRVARDLADRDDIDNVSMSVDNYGAAGWIASEYHEDDDRPSGTVRATVPAEDA